MPCAPLCCGARAQHVAAEPWRGIGTRDGSVHVTHALPRGDILCICVQPWVATGRAAACLQWVHRALDLFVHACVSALMAVQFGPLASEAAVWPPPSFSRYRSRTRSSPLGFVYGTGRRGRPRGSLPHRPPRRGGGVCLCGTGDTLQPAPQAVRRSVVCVATQ